MRSTDNDDDQQMENILDTTNETNSRPRFRQNKKPNKLERS